MSGTDRRNLVGGNYLVSSRCGMNFSLTIAPPRHFLPPAGTLDLNETLVSHDWMNNKAGLRQRGPANWGTASPTGLTALPSNFGI